MYIACILTNAIIVRIFQNSYLINIKDINTYQDILMKEVFG